MAKGLIDAGVGLANAPADSWSSLRDPSDAPKDTRVLYNGLFLASLAGKNGNFTGSNLQDLYKRGVISAPGTGKLQYNLHNAEPKEIERFFQNTGKMSLAQTSSPEYNEYIKSDMAHSQGGMISNSILKKYKYRDLFSKRYAEILNDYIPEGKKPYSPGVLSDLLEEGHIEFNSDGFEISRPLGRQSDRIAILKRSKILEGLDSDAKDIYDAVGFSGDPRVSDRSLYLGTNRFVENFSDFSTRLGEYVQAVEDSGVPMTEGEKADLEKYMTKASEQSQKAAKHVVKLAQQNSVNVSQDSPEAPKKGSKAAMIASIIASAGFVTASGGTLAIGAGTVKGAQLAVDLTGFVGSAASLTSSSANAAFSENAETKTLDKRIVEEFSDDFLVRAGNGLHGMVKAANFFNENGLTGSNNILKSMTKDVEQSTAFAVREGNSANAIFNITQQPSFRKYKDKHLEKEVARVGEDNYLVAHYMGHKKDMMALHAAGWDIGITFATDGFASDDVDGAHKSLLDKFEDGKGNLTILYEQLPESARFPYDLRRGRLVLTPNKDKLLTGIKDDNHISTGRAHSKDNSIQNFRDDVRNQFARELKDADELVEDWWTV
ncbi:hypothetical protein [Parasedimentitalea huanghaiensis]|nr:hypothetical protein [Zongyanglinia huanghaiensis]